jgi:GR25 family glycosyltransferase involved in LPS biosynthesis
MMDIKYNFDETILAAVIADLNDHTSTVAARNVIQSIRTTKSELDPVVVQATTPFTLDHDLKSFGLTRNDWTYPRRAGETKIDIKTGLHLTGYNAKDINKVISCTVSHMRVWYFSVKANMPVCVLEHDALFTKRFIPNTDLKTLGIIGLNDPRGATRKSQVYLEKVMKEKRSESETLSFVNAPYVDDNQDAPQGIAGNSAYIVGPRAARQLLDKVNEIGLWPNDALMCKQFFPYLKQAYPFYTRLQGVQSTTQG